MKKLPRIIAVFQPQAWINDYATSIDGRKEFDCTKTVLQMSAEDILKLKDDQYNTDDILPSRIMGKHSGPFYVAVQDRITEFLDTHNAYPLTEAKLKELRKLYKVPLPGRQRA